MTLDVYVRSVLAVIADYPTEPVLDSQSQSLFQKGGLVGVVKRNGVQYTFLTMRGWSVAR